MVSIGAAASVAPGQTPAPTETRAAETERAYPVGALQLEYDFEHAGQPPVETLNKLTVNLVQSGDAWAAAAPGEAAVQKTIGEIGGGMKLRASALRAVASAVRQYFTDHGAMAVYARVSESDIREDGVDRRPAGQTRLRIRIMLGSAREVRTVALGDRFASGQTVNNSKHQKLREGSPVKGDAPDAEGKLVAGTGNLLQKDAVEDYAARMSRQPGRRVDVAVSASDTPGEVTLDYLVSEGKPWYAFAQVSNTGTKNTSEWREHFGFVHNQLTSSDDVLSLDYTTADFTDASESFSVSYDLPIFTDRLRLSSTVSGSRFTASDLGLGAPNFEGKEYGVDEQLVLNVAQWHDTFVDIYAGVQWQNITGNSDPTADDQEGTAAYTQPYVGARLERNRDTHSWFADLRYLYGFTDADQRTVARLGRIDADQDWSLARLNVAHSFFLEPLLYPSQFREGKGTLANEVALSVRGQWVPGDKRVIAEQEQTAGGFYTVRGYPESLVAADNAVLATAEYRFHLPRALHISEPGTCGGRKIPLAGDAFRWAPDRPYARPDWDLILRAFVDGAKTHSHSTTQDDQTLVGAGVGMELQVRQNMALRLDLGVALNPVGDGADQHVESGDTRLHVSFMLLY